MGGRGSSRHPGASSPPGVPGMGEDEEELGPPGLGRMRSPWSWCHARSLQENGGDLILAKGFGEIIFCLIKK